MAIDGGAKKSPVLKPGSFIAKRWVGLWLLGGAGSLGSARSFSGAGNLGSARSFSGTGSLGSARSLGGARGLGGAGGGLRGALGDLERAGNLRVHRRSSSGERQHGSGGQQKAGGRTHWESPHELFVTSITSPTVETLLRGWMTRRRTAPPACSASLWPGCATEMRQYGRNGSIIFFRHAICCAALPARHRRLRCRHRDRSQSRR